MKIGKIDLSRLQQDNDKCQCDVSQYDRTKVQFTLWLPDNRDEFTMMSRAADYWLALNDLKETLRTELKYRTEKWGRKTSFDALKYIQDEFFNILADRNVDLDEIS